MDLCTIFRLLVYVFIGILALLKEGLGIECYECKSKIHPKCETLGSLSVEERQLYITKCWQLEGAKTKNYTNCRIIRQNIDGEKSMLRQCATGGHKEEMECSKKTGTRKIKMEYCECSDNLCNTASSRLRTNNEVLCSLFIAILTLVGYS